MVQLGGMLARVADPLSTMRWSEHDLRVAPESQLPCASSETNFKNSYTSEARLVSQSLDWLCS